MKHSNIYLYKTIGSKTVQLIVVVIYFFCSDGALTIRSSVFKGVKLWEETAEILQS